MKKDVLLEADSHFEFGQNWRDYAKQIDAKAIAEAENGLLALIPAEEIQDSTWLDIGSGSGLHSLAASRLGAAKITATDIDSDSVETTRKLLAAHGADATVELRSVFNMSGLGEFDIVYSWGVLHHTGDMWLAVRSAAEHVKPGGLFVIALYQRTPLCSAWKVEKRLYTSSPGLIRSVVSALYGTALLAAHTLVGKNPFKYVANYKTSRGMSYWHDVRDWLGGYPYESASPEETQEAIVGLGFEKMATRSIKPRLGIFGTGCAEYVFRKKI